MRPREAASVMSPLLIGHIVLYNQKSMPESRNLMGGKPFPFSSVSQDVPNRSSEAALDSLTRADGQACCRYRTFPGLLTKILSASSALPSYLCSLDSLCSVMGNFYQFVRSIWFLSLPDGRCYTPSWVSPFFCWRAAYSVIVDIAAKG